MVTSPEGPIAHLSLSGKPTILTEQLKLNVGEAGKQSGKAPPELAEVRKRLKGPPNGAESSSTPLPAELTH